MITKEQIQDCINHCSSEGHSVDIHDIAFLLLNREFKDVKLAYNLIYPLKADDDIDFEPYMNGDKMLCLRKYMNENWVKRTSSISEESSEDNSLTFEENRDALVKLLKETETAMNNKEIEKKDALKIMTDIRTKLNDKFNMKEQKVDQRIIVQPKFNHICSHTHKECWLMTEEWAKKQYHLIKDPNYKE